MTQGLTIRLAGVDFTGRRFRWEPGVYVKTFDGIDGGGETSFDSIPSGVGILDTDNKRQAPRTITITGFIYERTEWELAQRVAQLGALLGADDAVAEMTWQRTGEVRRANVRRLRFPPPTRRPTREPIADFTLTLRASDQRIYGAWSTSAWGPLIRVNNKGPFPAPVVIDVRGNADGYSITGPRGRVIQVTRSLAPGANHRHLGDEGVLLVGGVPQSDGVGRSDRIEVPYGPQEFTVDNGCELRVIFAPTWAP